MQKGAGAFVLTWFLFLLVAGTSRSVYGQKTPDPIAFERITIPGTIRSSQVSHIVQDHMGVLWFAGHGLFRYDGYGFKQYRSLGKNGGTLNPYDINALIYDSVSNRIFVGAHRFGVLVYEYETDQLVRLACGDDPPIINQLAQTSDGRIWASSFNEGIFYIDNDSLKKLPDPHGIYTHPTALLAKGNRVFIGGPAKVVVLENSEPVDEIMLSFKGNDFPAHADVTALHFDRNENLWIGTHKMGVVVYDIRKRTFTRHFEPSTAPFFSRITAIHEDRDGLFWILTKANGLVVFNPAENRMVHVLKDPFSAKSISTDNCFSILEDHSGIIWVGGTGDLNKFDKHQLKFRHIYHNPLKPMVLTDNMVRAVYEDTDGKIWVGTDAGYVNIIDLDRASVEHRKVSVAGSDRSFIPVYFHPLNAETTLVGCYGGLLQWNKRTNTFSPFEPLWDFTQGKVVRQVIRQGHELYFISSGQLYIYNLDTGHLKNIHAAGDSGATNLTMVYPDKQQRLWVGSARGVSLYNKKTGTFRFFAFEGLPRNSDGAFLLVLSIQQVGDYLYVGTFNAGLWRIDLRTLSTGPEIVNFTVRDGLPSNTIYASLPDKNGALWLSTNGGIVKFQPAAAKFISFSVSEGMQEEEFNRLAYAATRDGTIIFGGINGINIFHPDDIHLSSGSYVPNILSLRVYNPITGEEKVTTNPSSLENLELDYNENFLDIQFFVPHFSNPRRYSLYYMLENFENDWKEVTSDNKASFTNIDPGQYKFLLKTVALSGEEKVTEMSISISPPYWKTWWFILLSFFVVAFLVMTIIRSYIRKGEHDRQRLQELLQIRTFEIERSREELQVLNQKKDLIFSILSHDLRSPLTTLKGFLGYLIDHAHELSHDELKRHAVNIKNSVTNSLDLIDNTLFWSLSQMGNIQYTPTSFSLYYLIEKLRGLYQLTADKKRIAFSIQCPHDMFIHADENMVYVTLRNLVSNALKFTGEGKRVTVTCSPNEKYAYINVSDEGIGMSEAYLKKIRSSDQPMLKKGTSNEKGTGLGLLLCMQFIEMNKGELEIRSVEDQGTTFTVKLPLAAQELVSHQTEK